jgi:origin recognition complex subunit 1
LICSPKEFSRKFPNGKIPLKLQGKVFVCRLGCNTRTATYTNEFVWEDKYQGPHQLGALINTIQTQTKATRKRQAEARPRDDDDDFIVNGSDDEPRTPKKRRKHLDGEAATPKSKHKTTPRKFLTPTHKRIVVKKALEITPLGTRILPPEALASPYQLARNQLHVSSVPASLPCREEEFSEVYSQLEKAITDGSGSCIYIAGTPGTGKTATVREVVAQLNAAVMAEELDDFIFVEINGMKVTDPHQSYSLLWEALRGDRVSPSHALDLLEREFTTPSPRRVPCVVLMDELDQLVTKNQGVMYNFFNWPGLKHSRLIVLAVANTMDLPERTLSNKISSRLGLHRITFKGYTHSQLIQIIESRLANVPGRIVHPDAIQFAARKVAAVSGDARRALDICRRAVEIAENDAAGASKSKSTEDFLPDTPSKTGRGKKRFADEAATRKDVLVTIATVKQAISEATSSPLQRYLRGLPLSAKVFLAALLARNRRTGISEALIGDVADEARRLAMLMPSATTSTSAIDAPVRSILLAERSLGDKSSKSAYNYLAPRLLGLEEAVQVLAAAGVLGVESNKRGERVRRVRLAIADEEVGLALREDIEVKGMV